MDKFKEVNWSAVARDAIEAYLKRRRIANIAPIVERLAKEKEQLYNQGLQEGYRLTQKLTYVEYEQLLEAVGIGMPIFKATIERTGIEIKGNYYSSEFRHGLRDAFEELKKHL